MDPILSEVIAMKQPLTLAIECCFFDVIFELNKNIIVQAMNSYAQNKLGFDLQPDEKEDELFSREFGFNILV